MLSAIQVTLSESNKPGIDFELKPASFLGVLGSQAEQLLAVLAGRRSPGKGQVFMDQGLLPACSRANLAFATSLEDHLSLMAMVNQGRRCFAHCCPRSHQSDVVHAALEWVGLADQRFQECASLSRDQQAMVALATAVAALWDPPQQGGRYLLIPSFIQPQSGSVRRFFLSLLRELVSEGFAVLLGLDCQGSRWETDETFLVSDDCIHRLNLRDIA